MREGFVISSFFICPTNLKYKKIVAALTGNTKHESTSIKVVLQHSDMMITDRIKLAQHSMLNTEPFIYMILNKSYLT